MINSFIFLYNLPRKTLQIISYILIQRLNLIKQKKTAMSRIFGQVKSMIQTSIAKYRIGKLNRLYSKGKYAQMAGMFKKTSDYATLKVDQFPFVYFLISEANEQALKTFVQKVPFKDHLLIDDTNPLKSNPLTFAVLQGKTQFVSIFEKIGASLQTPNSEGQNLLHLSAIYRRNQAFQFAIQRDVDLNFQDQHGNTPFHYACRTGIVEMITSMIAAKAKRIQNKNFQYPIHMAIESGQFNAFRLLLSDLGKNYQKYHPIHSAARSGSPDILRQILKYSPLSICYKDFKGLTALHHAVIVQDEGMVSLILKQKQIRIDEQDKYGNTALHLAVINKNLSISEILIKAKANLDIKNEDFMSPAEYGLSSGVAALSNFLKEYASTSKTIRDWGTSMKY